MVLGKLPTHRRLTLGPRLIPHTKIDSKWIKHLNLRTETIKLSQEYTGKRFADIALDKCFSDITPKTHAMEKKQINCT